ncbi:hypothetical protein GEMRC1_013145 [Eukaryota sp. GEM-RC1]
MFLLPDDFPKCIREYFADIISDKFDSLQKGSFGECQVLVSELTESHVTFSVLSDVEKGINPVSVTLPYFFPEPERIIIANTMSKIKDVMTNRRILFHDSGSDTTTTLIESFLLSLVKNLGSSEIEVDDLKVDLYSQYAYIEFSLNLKTSTRFYRYLTNRIRFDYKVYH